MASSEGGDQDGSDGGRDSVDGDDDIWKASHPIWGPQGKWAYAEKARGRIFMITTDWHHPDTGEEVITPKRVEEVLGRKVNLRTAWTNHDQDTYTQEDMTGNSRAILGQIKPAHVHAVEERRNVTRLAQVARAYRVPPNFIKLGKGHGAFLDFCEYLTHESEKEQKKGKHLYDDELVHANFDFRLEVDEHVAARKSGSSGSGSAFQRKVDQALLDVMEGRKSPDDIRDDPDLTLVYAKHHQKLKDLHLDFLGRDENRPKVGATYRKATVAILGSTRSGKGLLADCVRDETILLAEAAGESWRYAQPAGRNALEGIGTAEVVHHDDARFWLLPTYDEWLRYLDPNRATEVATRFRNRPPVAPRVIMASSSQSLLSLALTSYLQKMPSELAETAQKRKAVNIDEFLLRIGWLVQVSKPAGETDPDTIRREMTVAIAHVVEGDESRVQGVHDGDGLYLGDITTRHRIEPVAVIKGAERTARFLAVSVIAECSPDIAAKVPGDVLEGYVIESQTVIAEEQVRRQELEQARREREMEEKDRELARLQKQLAAGEKEQARYEQARLNREAQERQRAEAAERNRVRQSLASKGFIFDAR